MKQVKSKSKGGDKELTEIQKKSLFDLFNKNMSAASAAKKVRIKYEPTKIMFQKFRLKQLSSQG